MKAMRKLVWMLLAVSMVGFASCDSDDDDEWIDDGGQGSGGSDEGGVVTPSGSGTYADPWNVAAAKENQDTDYKFVKGFIVGQVPSGDLEEAQFEAPFSGTSVSGEPLTEGQNILIAATADEKNVNNCLVVQLNPGALRTGLNLITEGNAAKVLGKEVILQGNLEKYFGVAGMKSTSYAILVESSEEFGAIIDADGDFNVPEISIADVRAMYQGSGISITEDKKIVGVVISDVVNNNVSSLKQIIVAAEDNSCGIVVFCSENNESFLVGDKVEVRVKGLLLKNYYGTIELDNVPLVNIRKVGTGTITPRVTTVADIVTNFETWQSTLVTVQGEYVPKLSGGTFGSSSAATTNTIKDGDDEVNSYVSKFAKFCSTLVPTGVKSITAIVSVYSNAPQLNVRSAADIK